jgi:hypothetical protein
LKKKKIIEKNIYFKQLKLEYIEKNAKIKNYLKKNKNILSIRRIKNNSKSYYSFLFKKRYNLKLINKYNIDSSLNNLFNKFYNIPKLTNFSVLKNYLKNYKIILNNHDIKKIDKGNFISDIILYKNYTKNINLNLSKFIKMYGFR